MERGQYDGISATIRLLKPVKTENSVGVQLSRALMPGMPHNRVGVHAKGAGQPANIRSHLAQANNKNRLSTKPFPALPLPAMGARRCHQVGRPPCMIGQGHCILRPALHMQRCHRRSGLQAASTDGAGPCRASRPNGKLVTQDHEMISPEPGLLPGNAGGSTKLPGPQALLQSRRMVS